LVSDACYKYEGKDNEDLMVLDGVRAMACIWLLCLSECIRSGLSATANPWINLDLISGMPFTLLSSSHLCFDEFFMLGAFLTTIKIIPYIRKSERARVEEEEERQVSTQGFKMHKSIPQLFIYRVLRLAPLYYLIFFIGWLIMPFVG
jgi:hypothetical protein